MTWAFLVFGFLFFSIFFCFFPVLILAPLLLLSIEGHKPTKKEVDLALTLPGGGKHKVAPGQVTDDSELWFVCFVALSCHSFFSHPFFCSLK
jgi:hypothetical protein